MLHTCHSKALLPSLQVIILACCQKLLQLKLWKDTEEPRRGPLGALLESSWSNEDGASFSHSQMFPSSCGIV